MNKEIFNEIVDMFKKRNHILTVKGTDMPSCEDQIEMLKMGVTNFDYRSPYTWMVEWHKLDKEIIFKFNSINEEWCKKYYEDKVNFPKESTKFPLIFCDFKDYVDKLVDEKYEECEKIKLKIFENY